MGTFWIGGRRWERIQFCDIVLSSDLISHLFSEITLQNVAIQKTSVSTLLREKHTHLGCYHQEFCHLDSVEALPGVTGLINGPSNRASDEPPGSLPPSSETKLPSPSQESRLRTELSTTVLCGSATISTVTDPGYIFCY